MTKKKGDISSNKKSNYGGKKYDTTLFIFKSLEIHLHHPHFRGQGGYAEKVDATTALQLRSPHERVLSSDATKNKTKPQCRNQT